MVVRPVGNFALDRNPETYLGSYEIILARRIKETIDMFDEGLARWFSDKNQRVTLAQKRSYKVISDAFKTAKDDRQRFIQLHKDVPGAVLADLFNISTARVSQLKHSRELAFK